ncbi:hypothetical protein FGO68_gene1217 [Halteria grandinella]|uniref:C2 domain-containing protein n=1 Tax=Halteria grandinella TaxID=5974 RepID=A0A8J8NVX2_HALGN|nr:hypothetical protein FGO68_gene1217 [Halteria grandinella]
MFVDMDPFLEITHQGQKFTAFANKESGKTPIWNQSFTIELGTIYDLITIKCFDQDVMLDDCVGEGSYMASKLCHSDNQGQVCREWHELQHKGKKAALVLIEAAIEISTTRQLGEQDKQNALVDHQLSATAAASNKTVGERKFPLAVGRRSSKTMQFRTASQPVSPQKITAHSSSLGQSLATRMETSGNFNAQSSKHGMQSNFNGDPFLMSATLQSNFDEQLLEESPKKEAEKVLLIGPGILKLTFFEAKLTRDTELLGKMDPYVQLKYGTFSESEGLRTQTCENGGLFPVWNQSIELQVREQETRAVQIQCWDEDLLQSDIIGESVVYKVDQLMQYCGENSRWLDIYFKGKRAGEILIEFTFQAQTVGSKDLEDFGLYEQSPVNFGGDTFTHSLTANQSLFKRKQEKFSSQTLGHFSTLQEEYANEFKQKELREQGDVQQRNSCGKANDSSKPGIFNKSGAATTMNLSELIQTKENPFDQRRQEDIHDQLMNELHFADLQHSLATHAMRKPQQVPMTAPSQQMTGQYIQHRPTAVSTNRVGASSALQSVAQVSRGSAATPSTYQYSPVIRGGLATIFKDNTPLMRQMPMTPLLDGKVGGKLTFEQGRY